MQSSTQFDINKSHSQQISYGLFLFISFLVWLIATVIMRLWGHTFFIAENNLSMSVNFLFSLFCLPPLVYVLFRWQNVRYERRRDVAICLAIPGMLLDVITTYFFEAIYPNVLPTADGAYGAWLLWGYALVLITGWVTGQKSQSPTL